MFVRYFGSCPVLKVSGRAFPVKVIWQDFASEENKFEKYEEAAVDKAVEIHRKKPSGDILVFLASASEIQKCCDMLQQKLKDFTDFQCMQLHGQLQADEQQRVFQPPERNKRKIVFATNCAETSNTIDGTIPPSPLSPPFPTPLLFPRSLPSLSSPRFPRDRVKQTRPHID